MESNVTLYWFCLPKWFMDMGGFEKEANIKEFVEWGRLAFRLFGEEHAFGFSVLPTREGSVEREGSRGVLAHLQTLWWKQLIGISVTRMGACGAGAPRLQQLR